MGIRFEDINNATKGLLLKYPEIKGTYYSLFFWTPGDKVRGVFFSLLKDFLIPRKKLPSIKDKIWYLIHGELPSNHLNLQSITDQLKINGVNGKILYYKSKLLENYIFPWEKIKIKRPSIYIKKIELLKLFFKAIRVAKEYDYYLKNYGEKNRIDFPDKRFLESNLYLVLKFDLLAKILIYYYKPKIVITGVNSGYFINPIFRHSKSYGILTISVQHGEIGEYEDIEDCSYFVCWGNYYKEKLIRKNIPEDKLISIGSPRFDNILIDFQKRDKKTLKTKFGFSENDNIILHISDGNFGKNSCPDYPEKLLRSQKEVFPVTFFDLSKKYKVIVKLHPGEASKNWEELKIEKNFKIFDNNYNIYELIKISDIVSTVASIAGFESSILGKPVIYYSPENINLIDYPEKGFGFKAKDSKEWIQLVEKLLNDKIFYEISLKNIDKMKEHFILNLGNSSEKIAEFIMRNLNEK